MREKRNIALTRRGVIICGIVYASLPQLSFADNIAPEDYGRLARVINGHSIVLKSGLRVRLANIFAPELKTDFSAEAKNALLTLLNSRPLGLFYQGAKRDRYDRALAQLFTLRPDGTPDQWVQAEMVRMGYARVRSYAGTAWRIDELLKLEVQARDAQRGLWQSADYSIRSPAPNILAQDVDSFQIVEGLVISSAQIRGQTYLNFGSNYKTDFTVSIARKHKKTFEKAGFDLANMEGLRLRVRGWVELYNGPVIWLDHPQAIEQLNSALS